MEFTRPQSLNMDLLSLSLLDQVETLREEKEHYRDLYEKYRELEGLQFIDKVTLEDILGKLRDVRLELTDAVHEASDIREKAEEVLSELEELQTKYELLTIKGDPFRCPLCRELSLIPSNQVDVKGVDNKCCACLEKEVEVFFGACGHVPVCRNCLKDMDKA